MAGDLVLLFLQYVLHNQFKSVSDYARKNGVVLKGDLPIGVSRTSVEAWTEPKYFNMNGQAGAPPDDFSMKVRTGCSRLITGMRWRKIISLGGKNASLS